MNAIVHCLFYLQLRPIILNQVINIIHVKLHKTNPYCELLGVHFLFNQAEDMDSSSMKVSFAV